MATDSTKILYGTDGYLTVNGTDIGHLSGDIVLDFPLDVYYPELSRARGKVKGTGRVTGGIPKITCTMAQWQYSVLSTLYSHGAVSDANSEKIGSGAIGTVTEIPNIIVTGVTRNDGKAFRATLAYAIVSSPISVTLAKAAESLLEVTFEALYTDAAPSTYPGWIEFAK